MTTSTNLPPPAGRRRLAAALCLALAAAGCASARAVEGTAHPSPRLHHLLDLEDARAPVRELEPFLRDADPAVRARAALAVGRKGGGAAPPLLRLALRDPEGTVRAAAAFALGLSGAPELAGDALAVLRGPGAGAEESAAAAAAAVWLSGEHCWREGAYAAPFGHPSAAIRRAAFRALAGAVRGWKEKPPAAPAWLAAAVLVPDPDPEVRAAAALVLRGLPAGPAAEPLSVALARGLASDPDPDVRASYALALGRISTDPLPALERALREEALPRVRAQIARALGAPGAHAAGAAPALRAALAGDPDHGVRTVAAEGIGADGDRAAASVDALVAAAGDPSRMVRVAVLGALHASGDGAALASVASAAASPDPWIRAAAPGPLLSVEALAVLARDGEIRVRESAVAEAGARGRQGLAVCLEALGDSDPVVAAIAATALGEMGATETVEPLRSSLRRAAAPVAAPDDGADLRAASLEALGRLAPGTGSTTDLARAHLLDPDPAVRAAAAGILGDAAPPDPPPPPRLLPFPDRTALPVSDGAAPLVEVETNRGTFTVRLAPSAAPVHVARFLARVREGGYDGTVWHRIVPNFVVQGGDPRGDGSGNGGAPTRQEFSPLPYLRGTLGVPRSTPPDSGGCQLFFCHGSSPHLDQRYTVMGRVEDGFPVLDALDVGDRIVRIRLR